MLRCVLHMVSLVWVMSLPAAAEVFFDLSDTGRQVFQSSTGAGHYVIPTGPWEDGGMPAFEATGAVQQEVWQISDFTAGTGVLLAILTGQLNDAGFEPLFSCTTRVCGGFDFRFALDLAPEPDMHVNLSDYAFYAARRDSGQGSEYAAFVISEGGGTGFVQAVHVRPSGLDTRGVTLSTRAPDAALPVVSGDGTLAEALLLDGRAPLTGIRFAPGSTALEDETVPVLQELARVLRDNPSLRLTLVGHTDAEGGLASNMSLSRNRAKAVEDALIAVYGISPDRLSSEGVGFLMPLALNTTEAGRDLNRRVEAVVVNTQ